MLLAIIENGKNVKRYYCIKSAISLLLLLPVAQQLPSKSYEPAKLINLLWHLMNNRGMTISESLNHDELNLMKLFFKYQSTGIKFPARIIPRLDLLFALQKVPSGSTVPILKIEGWLSVTLTSEESLNIPPPQKKRTTR